MIRGRRLLGAGFAAVVATAGLAVVSAPVARAETVTVTNLEDDGTESSLRGVLEGAQSGDVVELVPGATYSLTRCLIPKDAEAQVVFSFGELVAPESVTINGNGATLLQTCPGWRVLLGGENLTLNDLTITGGTSRGGGGGVRLDGAINEAGVQGPTVGVLVIRNSSIVGNCSLGSGGGIKMNVDGDVEIYNSTIANNEADDNGGGFSHSHSGTAYIENTTVTNNAARGVGGIEVRNGDLTAVYSDIVDNSLIEGTDCGLVGSGDAEEDAAPTELLYPSNLVVNGEGSLFYSFGTVIALPNNGDVNCANEGTVSSGYNYSDDDSCGFDQATDTQGGGDPQLGALGANGGPTATRLPALTSPLVDAIPSAACAGGDVLAAHAITTDQRSLARPETTGGACDIGAVEIQAQPAEIQPTFTG